MTNLTDEEKRIIVPALIKLFQKRQGERKAIKGYDNIIFYLMQILGTKIKFKITARSIRRCISHIREYPQHYKIFIMANVKGFFVPKTREEAAEFIKRWKAYMETMQRVYNGIHEYGRHLPSQHNEIKFPDTDKK